MSDYVDTVDIEGVQYDIQDSATKATADQNQQDIEAMKESTDYSTTEHLTGHKWLDGRPTYEITVACGALPSAGEMLIPHNVSNIQNIVRARGIVFENQTRRALPLPYSFPDIIFAISLNISLTDVRIGVGTDRQNFGQSFVTFEYTKTTDSPQP